MVGPSDVNRPFSGCLYTTRVHIGIKSLIREHEGTLTQTELALIVQIPLLGVSVLPAFGPKIASTATTHDINPFLFTCCFHLIFQYMHRAQNQSMGTFRFEITELLRCQFRYRHRHFQVLGGPKIASMVVPSDINRPLSSYLYNFRVHTGIKSLSREHEGTLTQTELALIVQIPLLGVSVLPAFGPKIASTGHYARYKPISFHLLHSLNLSAHV